MMRVCHACNKYTLSEQCCQQATKDPRPPKYSPEDRYGEYRREAKRRQGLL